MTDLLATRARCPCVEVLSAIFHDPLPCWIVQCSEQPTSTYSIAQSCQQMHITRVAHGSSLPVVCSPLGRSWLQLPIAFQSCVYSPVPSEWTIACRPASWFWQPRQALRNQPSQGWQDCCETTCTPDRVAWAPAFGLCQETGSQKGLSPLLEVAVAN